jgi:hypothetical protein
VLHLLEQHKGDRCLPGRRWERGNCEINLLIWLSPVGHVLWLVQRTGTVRIRNLHLNVRCADENVVRGDDVAVSPVQRLARNRDDEPGPANGSVANDANGGVHHRQV